VNWIGSREGLALPKPSELHGAVLPLAESGASHHDQTWLAWLHLIDAAAGAGHIVESPDAFVIPWESAEALTDEARAALSVPPTIEASVRLVSVGAPLQPGYRLEGWVAVAGRRLRREERQHGVVFEADRAFGCLPARVVRLLERCADVTFAPIAERFTRLAEVREEAISLGWTIPPEVASCQAVRQVALDVEVAGADEMFVRPTLRGVPGLDASSAQRTVANATSQGGTTIEHIEGRAVRLSIPADVQHAFQSMECPVRVTGTQVPEFMVNPAAFLPKGVDPEAVDLSLFSDRVKGVLPSVYRSRPYVQVERSGEDWFSVEPRGDLEPEVGTGEARSLSGSEWREVVEKAAHDGDRFVKQGRDWIEVDDAKEELERLRRFDERFPSGHVPTSHVSFVLEIFENIDALNYSPKADAPAADSEVALPDWFGVALKSHQIQGLRWLWRHHLRRSGALLADEMGVGKTAVDGSPNPPKFGASRPPRRPEFEPRIRRRRSRA